MTTDRRAFLPRRRHRERPPACCRRRSAKAMTIPARHRTRGTIMDVEARGDLHAGEPVRSTTISLFGGALNGVRGLGDPRPRRLPGGASVWRQPSQEHPDGFVLPFPRRRLDHQRLHRRRLRPGVTRRPSPSSMAAATTDGATRASCTSGWSITRPRTCRSTTPWPAPSLVCRDAYHRYDPDPDLPQPAAPLDRAAPGGGKVGGDP
ncbi:hypothetical protein ACRAWD_32120 [Caulobacter segnis]